MGSLKKQMILASALLILLISVCETADITSTGILPRKIVLVAKKGSKVEIEINSMINLADDLLDLKFTPEDTADNNRVVIGL